MIAQPAFGQGSETTRGFTPPLVAQPLSLRCISRESLLYLNQTGLRRPPLEFDWLSATWTLTLHPIASPALRFAESVMIDWGGSEVILRVEQALLEAALRETLQTDSLGALSGELRAVIVEAAFASLARTIEMRLRKRLRLIETCEEPDAERSAANAGSKGERLHGLALQLSDGAMHYACEAWIDELALGFLADALRDWTPDEGGVEQWSRLPIPVHISAGWTTLDLASVRKLRLHDVILMDECLVDGDDDRVLIRLGGRLGIRGKLSGSMLTITDWLDDIMDDIDDYDEQDEDLAADAEGNDQLDQIPVRMSFDLGERMMTLAELRVLAPGYVIELGREVRRAVAIRVNGRKIGEGELVDIDGSIGVSIVAINPPSA